jgi:hypothetical protein
MTEEVKKKFFGTTVYFSVDCPRNGMKSKTPQLQGVELMPREFSSQSK